MTNPPTPSELPLDLRERPAFSEPWEATAFALAVELHANKAFAWPELATELGARRAAEPASPYYEHWLGALEAVVITHHIVTRDELSVTAEAWHDAAERTPHGQPILLFGCRER